MTTPVGIVGFRGYSGAELERILERHPHAMPIQMEHRSDSAGAVLPRAQQTHCMATAALRIFPRKGFRIRRPSAALNRVDYVPCFSTVSALCESRHV